MKKHYVIGLLLSVLLYGCSGSVIKINKVQEGAELYPMYGGTPDKNFSVSKTINDDLVKKWENDINGGLPLSSVTAYGSFIFVSDLSGRVYCFNDSSGKIVGKLKYKGAVFSAPIIERTNIIFAVVAENNSTSSLVSYNFLTGKENYNKEIKGKVLTEIIKTGDSLIFTSERGTLYKYNISGEEIWKHEFKKLIHTSPSLYKGTIILGNDKGEILAVESGNGKLIYKKQVGKPFFGGASIRKGTAFIGNDNGKLYAVDLSSGNIKWEFFTGARITMIPAVKDNLIVVGNLNGDLFAVDETNGSEIWKTSTGGLLNAAPLITNNMIIVPDYNKKFYLVDIKTGDILKTFNLDGRVKLSPVILNNTIFIGYENGNICAYEF